MKGTPLFVLGCPTVTEEVKEGGQRSRTHRQSFARVLPRAGTDVCSSVRGDCTLVSDRAQVARPHQGTHRRGNPWVPVSQPQQEDPQFVPDTETGGCWISRVASGLDKKNIDSHADALKIKASPSFSKHDIILLDSCVTPRRQPGAQLY